MDKLVDIAEMMNGINAHSDENSGEFRHELETNVGLIVDKMIPASDSKKKKAYKSLIVGGMYTAVSKAYQYHLEERLSRNNTTIVVDPNKASNKRARRP
jgi:hypothetical protein